MNRISFDERKRVYEAALAKWGTELQATVAIEELSEVQKEICKMLRGKLDLEHMAEEIADATIMLEQLRQMLDINDSVCAWMDYKITVLEKKVDRRGDT